MVGEVARTKDPSGQAHLSRVSQCLSSSTGQVQRGGNYQQPLQAEELSRCEKNPPRGSQTFPPCSPAPSRQSVSVAKDSFYSHVDCCAGQQATSPRPSDWTPCPGIIAEPCLSSLSFSLSNQRIVKLSFYTCTYFLFEVHPGDF